MAIYRRLAGKLHHLRIVILFFLCWQSGQAMAAADGSSGSRPFTIVMLPDTQNYSESHPEIFNSMTRWIADNQGTSNIVGVVHVGDIVQNGRKGQSKSVEWERADAAMSQLDGVVPWGIVAGNHDSDTESYLAHFGPRRFEGQPWFVGSSPDQLSSAQLFASGPNKILSLHLQINASDESLRWAESVLKKYPGVPAMVTTHVYLTTPLAIPPAQFGREQSAHYGENSGEGIWYKFVRRNPQVFLVCCGHWAEEYTQFSRNDAGSTTIEMMCDYDARPARNRFGAGLMRLITVNPAENVILMRTYSPWLDQWETDGDSQFLVKLDLRQRDRRGPAPPASPFPKPRTELVPILELKFNETADLCLNTGRIAQWIKMLDDSRSSLGDLRSLDGEGVSGKKGDRAVVLRSSGMNHRVEVGNAVAQLTLEMPGLDGLSTLTVQGWLKSLNGQRASEGVTLLRYGNAFTLWAEDSAECLAFAIGSNPKHRSISNKAYGATGKWTFFAVTYDGTMWPTRIQNVHFYAGSSTDPVREVAVRDGSSIHPYTGEMPVGQVLFLGDDVQGESTTQMLIDNIRVFGSAADTGRAGMLTRDELEMLRTSDLENSAL